LRHTFQGSSVGLEGVRAFLADFAENFDTWEIDCRDVRDLGDTVLALGINHATGKGSGVETELPFPVVASFQRGSDNSLHRLRRQGRGPRSRRAAGVGDVAARH
jgi:hypothetical protein